MITHNPIPHEQDHNVDLQRFFESNRQAVGRLWAFSVSVMGITFQCGWLLDVLDDTPHEVRQLIWFPIIKTEMWFLFSLYIQCQFTVFFNCLSTIFRTEPFENTTHNQHSHTHNQQNTSDPFQKETLLSKLYTNLSKPYFVII